MIEFSSRCQQNEVFHADSPSSPFDFPCTGWFGSVRAGGLAHVRARPRFHAYESKTGKLLWETMLPDHGYANPITYLGKNHKQYVVIDSTDAVVAFALP